MAEAALPAFDPDLDLVLERKIDVPRQLVWDAWTSARHIPYWFVPAPWTITECEVDLRPGGIFKTVMRSPEGQEFPNHGCFLEIVPGKRLIWTDALAPGYRPTNEPFMTAILSLEDAGEGTHYVATAMHRDAEARQQHEKMGFHDGWGKVVDQLVDYIKTSM